VIDTVAVGKGSYIVPWVSEMRRHWEPAYEAVMLGKMTPKKRHGQRPKRTPGGNRPVITGVRYFQGICPETGVSGQIF
jgi:hypothetical protein